MTRHCVERFPPLPARSASKYSSRDQAVDGTFTETYHSLACHELVTLAATLSYGCEENFSLHCSGYVALSYTQLQQCHRHTKVGYCSNPNMDATGETALFAANLTNLLHLHMSKSGNSIDCNIQLVHQGQVHKSYFDIGWYWQDSNDSFPFAIIEYTKTSAADKVAQLRAYANIMFHASTVPHDAKDPHCSRNGWIPLLTIKLSHSEIIYSVVCITRVASGVDAEALKFTEIPLCTKVFTAAELSHMMHVLYEWHLAVLRFFSAINSDRTPSSGVREILRLPKIHERLLLDPESNHVKIVGSDGAVTVVKVYDYRSVVNKSWIPEADRRSPDAYEHSTLKHEELISWSGEDPGDSLRIIKYPAVKGDHVPRTVGHFVGFIAELEKIHQKGIVHGDLRFSNVVFFKSDTISSSSSSSSSSFSTTSSTTLATIIDFDLSGRNGNKVYPSGFNLQIDDGKRHPDVKALSSLQFEHDIFAVVWMLRQYRPKPVNHHDLWAQAINCLENKLTADFYKITSGFPYDELEAVEGVALPVNKSTGTGSPEREEYGNA
jgi:hypothetical protein